MFDINKAVSVYGSYGVLWADPMSGRVVGYEPDPDDGDGGVAAYEDIVKVNLVEYRRFYGDRAFNNIDIVDIGFWEKPMGVSTGSTLYCEAEADHRCFNDDPALRPSVILL